MSKLSIRFKMIFWFTIALALIVLATFLTFTYASQSVIRKNMQDNLFAIVEENSQEIVYVDSINPELEKENRYVYLEYKDGYLQIDEDFMDTVNGITTALYSSDGELIYGEATFENPVLEESSIEQGER